MVDMKHSHGVEVTGIPGRVVLQYAGSQQKRVGNRRHMLWAAISTVVVVIVAVVGLGGL